MTNAPNHLLSRLGLFCLQGVALLLCIASAPSAEAQILQGQWVDASQADIEKYRKTDVTVVVLDRSDRAVQNAKVRLTQQRHDFVIGITIPSERMPPGNCQLLEVFRSFNAIALDRYTGWSMTPEDPKEEQVKRLAAWHTAIEPIRSHYGPVISADPARNHDRLSLLRPADLRDAVLARIDRAAAVEPMPDDYDLYADLLQQDMIERKLGQGMLPRMFDHALATQPKARFGVRVRNAISLQRGRGLASRIQKLEVRQIPLDHITIEQSFTGSVQPNALKRMLDEYVAPLPAPVTLARLEIGGATPVASAIQMETVLRLAFAQPRIKGIYLAGLRQDDLLEDNAALVDEDNQPTASGHVLDQLFTKLWHSDELEDTDERGNAQARVFSGWYVITATLPDGTTITSQAYIPIANRAKMIVLQATAAEVEQALD